MAVLFCSNLECSFPRRNCSANETRMQKHFSSMIMPILLQILWSIKFLQESFRAQWISNWLGCKIFRFPHNVFFVGEYVTGRYIVNTFFDYKKPLVTEGGVTMSRLPVLSKPILIRALSAVLNSFIFKVFHYYEHWLRYLPTPHLTYLTVNKIGTIR